MRLYSYISTKIRGGFLHFPPSQPSNRGTAGSIYPVVIFFICIGIASFLVLIFGNVLNPFFQLMNSHDTTIAPAISAPMGYMSVIITQWIWPKGVLAVILFGLIMWLLMDYQKNRYKDSG